MRRRQQEDGYIEVNTPQVLDRALWETSGHWQTYRENMFVTTTEDERVFALKPMNCPGHVQIFKNGLKSYRDLPMKIAEFGIVHRYEPSGAIHGMMRVRAFTQDDAHIFCTEDQIMAEAMKINDMVMSIYKDFGFEDVVVKLSPRPEKRVGTDEGWDKAEAALQKVLDARPRRASRPASTPAKAHSTARSSNIRCATPSAANGNAARPRSISTCRAGSGPSTSTRIRKSRRPVMIHRAIFGSLERFTGILIEHHAGHLPLWLSPVQAAVCTITSDADDYAQEIIALARQDGAAGRRPTCATRRSITRCANCRWRRSRC